MSLFLHITCTTFQACNTDRCNASQSVSQRPQSAPRHAAAAPAGGDTLPRPPLDVVPPTVKAEFSRTELTEEFPVDNEIVLLLLLLDDDDEVLPSIDA